MNNKNSRGFATVFIIVGILATTLVVGTAYYYTVNNSEDKTQSEANNENLTNPEQHTDSRDVEQNDNSYKLHGRLLAYNINRSGQYPESSADGWQVFIGSSKQEALIDPFTDEPYKFTSTQPEFGEIEYKYPASCDDARIDFVEANSFRSYAFRLKFSDGVRCSHSL